jgi:hypothetical protein
MNIMNRKKSLLFLTLLLLAAVFISGCTTPSGSPAAPTAAPTTIQTAPPMLTAEPTTLQATTTVVTATTAAVPAGKEILHETGMLSTKTYKTYNFKDMGYKFLYPKDKFKITIKSDKPVLGYAMNSEQSGQLQGSNLIPQYQAYSKGIDWGLIEPIMVMEKATDSTREFTLENVGPLTYVIDSRWMSYDPTYDNTPPFNYEITIVKTGGPTAQNFDF